MNVTDYHHMELRGALQAPEDGRNRPVLMPTDDQVLDVGCGIGQSFRAWRWNSMHHSRSFFGVDVDRDAIKCAKEECHFAIFAVSPAEHLPFVNESFDLVFSRVTLPYTDVPQALREMVRVLRKDGRIWLTLHPKDRPGMMLRDMKGLKKKAYRCVEWLNGHCLRLFGFVVKVNGRYISWQDTPTIVRMLRNLDVDVGVTTWPDGHFVIKGTKL